MLKFILDMTRILVSRLVVLVIVLLVFLVSEARDQMTDSVEASRTRLQAIIHGLEGRDGSGGKLEAERKKIRAYHATIRSNNRKIASIKRELGLNPKDRRGIEKLIALIDFKRIFKNKKKLLFKWLGYETDNSKKLANIANSNLALVNLQARLTRAKIELSTIEQKGVYDYLAEHNFPLSLLRPHHWMTLSILAFGLFLGPLLLKSLNFYVFAPLARKTSPIIINSKHDVKPDAVRYDPPQKQITIAFEKGQSLLIRPGWYTLNTDGITRTRFFWDRSKPFACYAMELVNLTEFIPDGSQIRNVKIALENDPNHDIIPVHLNDHPGYVIRHGHVVATCGDGLVMKKKWQIRDWKNWLYGNIRYFYFSGTGTVYVHGYGKVAVNDNEENSRIKERHIIGFDTTTPFKMIRTETFINYWINNKPLYDIHFPEQGSFLQQQSFGKKDEKIFRSVLEDIFGAFGKLLGF